MFLFLNTFIFALGALSVHTRLQDGSEGDGSAAVHGIRLRHKLPGVAGVRPLVDSKRALLCLHDLQLSGGTKVLQLTHRYTQTLGAGSAMEITANFRVC